VTVAPRAPGWGTMTRNFHLLCGGLALLAGAAAAQSSFTVTPLRVDLAPQAPAAIVTVINTSPGSLTAQVQQRAWIQSDGRDADADTRDLILSPPVFTLQPGEKQVVRVAIRGTPDARLERAYRLMVSELPAPRIRAAPDSSGFRIALRMDLPLFIAPLRATAPTPAYYFDAPAARLVVRNSGTGHIRYTGFTLLQAGRRVTEIPVFTVLAGGERSFELPRDRLGPGDELRVQAESNAGPIDAATTVLQ